MTFQMNLKPSELKSLLNFANGDVDQVAEMLRDFDIKELLAGPEIGRARSAIHSDLPFRLGSSL